MLDLPEQHLLLVAPEKQTLLLQLLAESAGHLLVTTDPDALVRGIFDRIAGPLGLGAYFNYMLSPQGDCMYLASCAGIPDDVVKAIHRLEFGQAVCGTAALLRQPIVATDIQASDDPKVQLVRGFGIRAYACNPLMVEGQLLGTLSFGSRSADRFDPLELDFFRAVTHYVSAAIRRVRLDRTIHQQAALLDLATDAIFTLDEDYRIQFWSRGAELTYGWEASEVQGRPAPELLRTEFAGSFEEVRQTLLHENSWEGELRQTHRDGSRMVVSSRWAVRRAAGDEPAGFLVINRDITRRKQFEEQLRHTAKLESLGVLAGGVAHDFNNLLTGILGNASAARETLPFDHLAAGMLRNVEDAAERAASLTRQLLAYAGKGQFVLESLDLSAQVRQIRKLVDASIPEGVDLRLELMDSPVPVLADASQIQQVVMNLIINAAEAIPTGRSGTVVVSTEMQYVDAAFLQTAFVQASDPRPGQYVLLQVQDNGAGMDSTTVDRIFDPFYTTKVKGRGLGLAAVMGIVRAHNGALKVYSTPGQGTTFKVLFPVHREAALAIPAAKGFSVAAMTRATVLVVDDEAVVRMTAKAALERGGHTVLVAASAPEALALLARPGTSVDLFLLDLTMPGMTAEEAIRELHAVRPDARILMSSGYHESQIKGRFDGQIQGFVQKPYTARALRDAVGAALRGNAVAQRGVLHATIGNGPTVTHRGDVVQFG